LSEKCIDYKVEGVRRRSIPKKTWKREKLLDPTPKQGGCYGLQCGGN